MVDVARPMSAPNDALALLLFMLAVVLRRPGRAAQQAFPPRPPSIVLPFDIENR
jgi:hypothetical protein